MHHDIFSPLQHGGLTEQRLSVSSAPRSGPGTGGGLVGWCQRRRREAGCGGSRSRSWRRRQGWVSVLQTFLPLPAAVEQQVYVFRQAHHAAAPLHQLQLHQVTVASRRVAPFLDVDDAQQGVDAGEEAEQEMKTKTNQNQRMTLELL